MAGIMSGPIPKRQEERRRTNKDVVPIETIDVASLVQREVEVPVADPAWHKAATMWYDALRSSAQCVFYEPSDWAAAYVLAEMLDRALQPKMFKTGQTGSAGSEQGGADVEYTFEERVMEVSPATITALLKGMTVLLATEGDRRRLRIEIERAALQQSELPEGVTDISSKREARV